MSRPIGFVTCGDEVVEAFVFGEEVADGRCCTTLSAKDSQCESMQLDRRHEQTNSRPLPHHELVPLQRFTEEALFFADLAG